MFEAKARPLPELPPRRIVKGACRRKRRKAAVADAATLLGLEGLGHTVRELIALHGANAPLCCKALQLGVFERRRGGCRN
ncbi:hypothetical protein VARIO8X_120198 [Burkholderiales bacterium 8X]|nr:hypothetical protein VARIO8X_120198 [Burkholderiales bacterium 8X]